MSDTYELDGFQKLRAKMILMDDSVSFSYKQYIRSLLEHSNT